LFLLIQNINFIQIQYYTLKTLLLFDSLGELHNPKFQQEYIYKYSYLFNVIKIENIIHNIWFQRLYFANSFRNLQCIRSEICVIAKKITFVAIQ